MRYPTAYDIERQFLRRNKMGRPLAKRFFGNRNIGTTGTSDNGIGGEGVASVVLNAKGNYTTRPTFTFSAPQITGGTTATGTISSEVNTVTPDGTLLNGINYVVGDLITFAGVTGTVGRVATVGSGQGEIQTVDFVGTGTNRGSFTTLPTNKTTLAVTVVGNTTGGSGSTGTGQTVAITFRASEVVITEKGSGYSTAPTSTPTQSVTFTSVALTADSGPVGSATNQENAIIVRAKTTSGGTSQVGDIQAQKGSHRYRVKTPDGTAVCKLVASATPAVNQAYILASDITGNDYYVMKLTARTAVIKRKSGGANYEFADPTLYPNGQIVKWTFGTQVLNTSVKIENA